MKVKYLTLFLFLLCGNIFAAPGAKDSLSKTIRMMQRGENDSLRFAANEIFTDTFLKVISTDTTFSANLSGFNNISKVSDEEGSIRIFTWTVPDYDGEAYHYFGYVQLRDLKKKTLELIPLSDSTASILKPESEKLSASRWYGAIYYSLIRVNDKKNVMFTLLGWKGKNKSVTQKVMEILTVSKGQIRFGLSVIKVGNVYKNRMIYSFNSQATMTLRYEKEDNRIVADHLSGPANQTANSGPLSGPDGSYDAFYLKKNKWIFKPDIDVDAGRKKPKNIPEPIKDDSLNK